MTRALPTLLLAIAMLLPMPVAASQAGTATPPAGGRSLAGTEPHTIAEAVTEAAPPASLPGNEDADIEKLTWEEHYGEALPDTAGAWVLTGSAQFPIASVIVFPSAEGAEAGLGEFARESAEIDVNGLVAYTVADRAKWICIATDGPVLIIGQAEPTSTDEDQDAVRDRACEAMSATHGWVVTSVTGAAPATPAG